jgi:hypothetical protein
MTELTLKEIRPSDLHLPEIKRDDIVRTLSQIELPDAVKNLDIGGAIADAAATVGRRGRRSPSRWPVAIAGLAIAGVASWAVLSNRSIRDRITSALDGIREWIGTMRSEAVDADAEDAVAFTAAETAEMQPPAFADPLTIDASEYPAGLGTTQDAEPVAVGDDR